ncbi:MAG: hypothetical protein AAGA68_19560 [Pseudomonadota bacterium]
MNLRNMIGGTCITMMLAAGTTHALAIDLMLSGPAPDVGDEFTVDVVASGVFDGLDAADELLGFGFDVVVDDPSVATFVGADVLMPFVDLSELFPDVDVAGGAFPGVPNQQGNDVFTIAALTFSAVGAGTTSLGIVSDTGSLNEGLIYLFNDPQDITSSFTIDVVEVHEPGALGLIAGGSLMLVLLRAQRRRR